ncbi:MAG: disulfide bond formation protein B [bacterium]
MNSQFWKQRWYFASVSLMCASFLAYAIYVQYVEYLDPCPLCLLQRAAYLAIGVVALIGFIHDCQTKWVRAYQFVLSLFAAIGAGIAGWHVYIQHLPADEVPDCGPGLSYMLDAFPLFDTLKMVFTGSGECAEVVWSFLGFSMPEWSLICFVGLLVSPWLFVKPNQSI